jgi:hypothetical protein
MAFFLKVRVNGGVVLRGRKNGKRGGLIDDGIKKRAENARCDGIS